MLKLPTGMNGSMNSTCAGLALTACTTGKANEKHNWIRCLYRRRLPRDDGGESCSDWAAGGRGSAVDGGVLAREPREGSETMKTTFLTRRDEGVGVGLYDSINWLY